MKVEMTVSMAGPDVAWNAGAEYDLDADEAKRLIDAGYAVPVGKPKPTTRESKTKVESRKGE